MKEIKEFEHDNLYTVQLAAGEEIVIEPGSMVCMSAGVECRTKTSGGFKRNFGRMLAGESFFVNEWKAGPYGGTVSFAPGVPGHVRSVDLAPGAEFYIHPHGFTACTSNVRVSSKWQGFGKGLFGGAGFFFVKTQLKDDPGLLAAFPEPAGPPAPGTRPLGPLGRVYFNSFGAIKEVYLDGSQPFSVDRGFLVGFDGSLKYSWQAMGAKTMFFGGQAFVLTFTGQGRVFIQTRKLELLAEGISRYLPNKG